MVSLTFSPAECEQRRERITSFISEQVHNAKASGIVIGLSGGIDSSLTAALAVEAEGADAVHGYSLPSRVTSESTKTDVSLLADTLGIEYTEIAIAPIIDTIIDQSPYDSVTELTEGNTAARTRAIVTYLIANQEGKLVVGTGNRSEALIGYFTKYGDGAVDCHPLGNLYKTQVRQLARVVGVPEAIIDKPPTAELWADQTDEGELGIDYDTLDRILALHVDGPLSVEATAQTLGCSKAAIANITSLVSQSEHKRVVPPSP